MDLHLDCEAGIICRVNCFSDCLYPVLIESAQTHLVGASYSEVGVRGAMALVKQDMLTQEYAIFHGIS